MALSHRWDPTVSARMPTELLPASLLRGSSFLERNHRHGPEQDRAALLVDLEKGLTVKAEGASGFSRQGHSPVWAHGNYASHALQVYVARSTQGQTGRLPNCHLTALPIIR
jgi:hypothetical protein